MLSALLSAAAAATTAPPAPPAVAVTLGARVSTTASTFVAHGWEPWTATLAISSGVLEDPAFRTTFSHLRGQTLRFGGISANWLKYIVDDAVTPACQFGKRQPFTADGQCPFSTGALDRLLGFLNATGVGLLFDLNELIGRNCSKHGPHNGRFNKPGSPEWCGGSGAGVGPAPWETAPVRALLAHIKRRGLDGLVGFELGNELYAPQHLAPETAVKDIGALGAMLTDVFGVGSALPPLYASGTNDCASRTNSNAYTMEALQSLEQPTGFSFHSYPGNPQKGWDKSDLASFLLNTTWLRSETLGSQAAPCLAAWNAGPRAAGLWLAVTEAAAMCGGTIAPGAPTTASFIHLFFSAAQLG
eukprot:3514543-Prymnesium_polylepis.1